MSGWRAVVAAVLVALAALNGAMASAGHGGMADEWNLTSSGGCRGSIGACLAVDELDSEVSRRVLQAVTKYISYGALKRDAVPCSVRGASYYNCRPGAYANPYHRGCSAITRCIVS